MTVSKARRELEAAKAHLCAQAVAYVMETFPETLWEPIYPAVQRYEAARLTAESMVSHVGQRTSEAAGRSLRPGSLAARILDVVPAEGATCAEVEGLVGGSHQSVSARLNELAARGHLVDSGSTRPGPSGRQQIVWRVPA